MVGQKDVNNVVTFPRVVWESENDIPKNDIMNINPANQRTLLLDQVSPVAWRTAKKGDTCRHLYPICCPAHPHVIRG